MDSLDVIYDILDRGKTLLYIPYVLYKNMELGKYEIRKINAIGKNVESLSVVLPRKYVRNLGIGKGDYVKVRLVDSKIIVERAGED
jgi:hypothetical protein